MSPWNRVRRGSRVVTLLAGDAQAVSRGRYGQRVANRLIGRGVARLMRSVWR